MTEGTDTGLSPEVTPGDDPGNASAEDYKTKGKTTVATPKGYTFASSDKSLPVIDSTGIKVTADQAEALTQESGGLVAVRNDSDKNEEE